MRIGSMTAAGFTFARPIDKKKPQGNLGDVGKRCIALCPPFSWNWRNLAAPGHR
jgi:hypothetical protein